MQNIDDPIKKARINNKSLIIYKNRKDVNSIKNQIMKEVNNPEYLNTLICFIHNQISKDEYDRKMDEFLCTNELKNLHNKMLRRIICNAHFSITPPPGFSISKQIPNQPFEKVMPPMPKPRNSEFHTYSSFEMGHLPSISQLNERIRLFLFMKSEKLKLDNDVAKNLQKSLFIFVIQVLQDCISLAHPPFSLTDSTVIKTQHLIHLYYSNSALSVVLSNEIITKYTSLA